MRLLCALALATLLSACHLGADGKIPKREKRTDIPTEYGG